MYLYIVNCGNGTYRVMATYTSEELQIHLKITTYL